jgi:UDP-N-acetylglucosamine--N-acetylmuramyl-(pentapeptide) pyrophosphoryl-undecaprenol N-acetylglucosamine transferase
MPALAIAEELASVAPGCEVGLAIGRRPGELSWVADWRGPLRRLFAGPMPFGWRPFLAARSAAACGLGTLQALIWWGRWRPAVVMAFGGYVSVPAGLAAALLGVPYIVHVIDVRPSRAARVLARKARLVTVNYPETAEAFAGKRVEVIGQPVRRRLFSASRAEALEKLQLAAQRPTLLVMGGSQGARTINYAAVQAAPRLLMESDVQVLHLAGQADYEDLRRQLQEAGICGARYKLLPYLKEMQWALAVADLAVSRCGANSLAELALAGVPLIMVPYRFAGGHQHDNALPLQRAGAGVIVEDAALSGERLAQVVLELLNDPQRRAAMRGAARRWARPDAARRAAELILEVAKEAASS